MACPQRNKPNHDYLLRYQHLHRDGPTFAHGSAPPSVGAVQKAEEMRVVPEGTSAKMQDGQVSGSKQL